MKYLIFRDKNFITMTAHESVKDKVLEMEYNSWALPVTDQQYRDFGEGNLWELNADNTAITITVEHQNPGTVRVSDSTEAQQMFKNHINFLKNNCEMYRESNPGLIPLVSFLDTVNTNIVTSISSTTNLSHIIYNLPDCPQVYRFETYSVDFLK